MNEKEKMLQGKIYDSLEEPLYSRRVLMSDLCIKYNNLPEALNALSFSKRYSHIVMNHSL